MELEVRPHRDTILADRSQRLFVSVRLKPGAEVAGPRVVPAVSIVVDTSGSMYGHTDGRQPKIQDAVEVIGSLASVPGFELGAEVSLVQADSNASVLLAQSRLARHGEAVLRSHATRLLQFNGGTMLARGIDLALQELEKASPNTARIVILITDGETGDADACRALASEAGARGVDLFCVGLGVDYNEDLLTELAAASGGALVHVASEDSRRDLHAALSSRLRHAQRESLQHGRLRLQLAEGVSVRDVSLVFPRCLPLPKDTDGTWRLGAIADDDDPVVLVECDVPAGVVGPLEVLRATVSFESQGQRPIALEHAVHVDRAVSATGTDDQVMHYVRQRNVTTMVEQAMSLSRQGDVDGATAQLERARHVTTQVGNVVLDRKLLRAHGVLRKGETLPASIEKDLKVTSRMGTTSIVWRGDPRES